MLAPGTSSGCYLALPRPQPGDVVGGRALDVALGVVARVVSEARDVQVGLRARLTRREVHISFGHD